MKHTHYFVVIVESNSPRETVRKVLDTMMNSGFQDVQDTLESDDGDRAAARVAVNSIFHSPK